MTRNDTLNKV